MTKIKHGNSQQASITCRLKIHILYEPEIYVAPCVN